ncbi:MAG: ACT domain-containing protein [Candidatus Micrarchaeota archaeon]
MRELTVVAKDRIGLLADISEVLAAKGVNIDCISVESSARTAVVRMLVEDATAARGVLEGAGFKVIGEQALMLRLKDKPGELAKVARRLADHGIGIENAMLVSRENNETLLAVTTSDNANARKLLAGR